MFRVCAEAARDLGAEGMQKALAKRDRWITLHRVQCSKWATTGRKRGDRAGLAFCPFNFPTECTCLLRSLGHLEAKSSRRNRLGVRQNREGKAGKIQLGHGDDVFSGHSEANAPSSSQKQQENFGIH